MALAEDFIDILVEYGHSVYILRRRDVDESGPYLEVDGGRYEQTAEKWTTYRWFPSVRLNVRSERLEDFGIIDGIQAVFYFQPSAHLKTGDLLYEDTPDERTLRSGYRIEDAVPYYLSNKVIYLAAHCKKIEPIS